MGGFSIQVRSDRFIAVCARSAFIPSVGHSVSDSHDGIRGLVERRRNCAEQLPAAGTDLAPSLTPEHVAVDPVGRGDVLVADLGRDVLLVDARGGGKRDRQGDHLARDGVAVVGVAAAIGKAGSVMRTPAGHLGGG
jgi:hypothetical protein